MAKVELSSKPKRVRRFIHNGQIYDGGAEEYFNGTAQKVGNDIRGTDGAGGVPKEIGGEEEKKK